MSLKKIAITDIEGFMLGNAENSERGTGCTVIICEDGATGGVDVRGGGPATRETDLLRSENTVNAVNAVVLSGGSAFGLEAASGVARELSDRGVGFDVGVGDIRVPIVCGASLFDLAVGDPMAFPDVGMGIEAVRAAYEGSFRHGNHGAGTGATVGKYLGHDRAMKTGLGTFACGDEAIKVGAVVAVNAIGDIYNGPGNIIAGLRSEDGQSIYGTIKTLKGMVHENSFVDDSTSFISREEIENELSKIEKAAETAEAPAQVQEEQPEAADETQAEDAYMDAPQTGDAPEAASYEDLQAEAAAEAVTETEPEAEPQAEAEAEAEPEAAEEAAEETAAEPEPEPEPKPELTSEEMGYDIEFNTTIGCLITNATLTKSQANKLASILHDAYARAIKPVHGTLDGDTIFVLSTGGCDVNFDAFAALATDVMQYAVIDAATSAKGAYGLPAARDMQ